MKMNNMVKILTVIIIILSIGLVGTTIKLISKDKWKSNRDTPTVVDKNSGNIEVIPEEDTSEIKKIDNSVVETPTEEEVEVPSLKDEEQNEEPEPTKEDKPDKNDKAQKGEDKDKKGKEDKDKDNNKNKDKDKKDKDDKKNKEDKNKDKKDDKKNNNNKKDKSEEKKSIVKSSYISKDEAIEIGIKKVGDGAKIIKIKSDLDDNPPKYELEIILGNYEYEIEIHAITGAVIDFEKDEK